MSEMSEYLPAIVYGIKRLCHDWLGDVQPDSQEPENLLLFIEGG